MKFRALEIRRYLAFAMVVLLPVSLVFLSPTRADAASENALSISNGFSHSCGTLVDGTVKCWGRNLTGQLGDGTKTDKSVPTVVADLSGVSAIATGSFHTCALMSDTTVKCWGFNGSGQLGDGTTLSRTKATTVTGLDKVVAISVGASHSCALLSDKTVKCWGSNSYGQLGVSGVASSSTPVLVSGLTNVVSLSVGANHNCVVLTDTTVRCWGFNDSGRLGDGTQTDRSSPVAVSGLSNVSAISLGGAHSCALLTDATVKCWGNNQYGQLGDSTVIDRSTPVAVSSLSQVVAIVTGHLHSCALLSDQSVKCWGYNEFGQLGLNNQVNQSTPITIVALSKVIKISAGGYESCAITSDQSSYCWGSNKFGQIGDNSTSDRMLPVTVTGLLLPLSQVGVPVVSGSAVVGGVLQVSPGVWDSGVTFSYQWLRDGAVTDVVGPQYQLAAVDLNTKLSVRVTGVKAGYQSVVQTSSESLIGLGTLSQVGIPVVSGSAVVGGVLQVSPGVWDSGVTFSYQWLRDGAVTDVVGTQYQLAAVDLNTKLSVRVTGVKAGYQSVVQTSSESLIGLGTLSQVGVPVVSGSALVGGVLQVSPGVWDSGVTFSYQWLRDGKEISSANSSKENIQLSDIGAALSVRVTASKSGYKDVSVVSAPKLVSTAVTNTDCSGVVDPSSWMDSVDTQPSISGGTNYGATLTGTNSTWPAGYKYCVYWYENGKAIAGAAKNKYKIQPADIGQSIQYVVVGSKKSSTTIFRFSQPVKITAAQFGNVTLPKITGTNKVGLKLTTTLKPWLTGTTFSYTWLRNGNPIAGVNTSSYQLVADDLSTVIGLTVCGSKQYYQDLCVTTTSTGTVSLGVITPVGKPAIAGNTTIGSTLQASPGKWQTGVSFSYQWLLDGKPVIGDVASSHKVLKTDKGHSLSVQVTGTIAGFQSITKVSSAKRIP